MLPPLMCTLQRDDSLVFEKDRPQNDNLFFPSEVFSSFLISCFVLILFAGLSKERRLHFKQLLWKIKKKKNGNMCS